MFRGGEGLLCDVGHGEGERRLGSGVQRGRFAVLAAWFPSGDAPMPVLRKGVQAGGPERSG